MVLNERSVILVPEAIFSLSAGCLSFLTTSGAMSGLLGADEDRGKVYS